MCSHLHDELDTFWIDEARVCEEALEERDNTREGTARHVTSCPSFSTRQEYETYQVPYRTLVYQNSVEIRGTYYLTTNE